MTFDYDWIVVGSGFGGSVSALRLAEKGYSVAVLECGKRFGDEDFPELDLGQRGATSGRRGWGCEGIFRLSFFKDVAVVSGCGVGGGSLGYANTLYVPALAVLPGPAVGRPRATGRRELAPHYETAQRMLGVVVHEGTTRPTSCCANYGEEIGVADTYRKTPIGVYLDKPGKTVPDPFFEGEGPERTGCMRAAAAWSAAPTAPRTPWSRTTSGWPRSAASRCRPSAR